MPKKEISSPPEFEKPFVEGNETVAVSTKTSTHSLSKRLNQSGQPVLTDDLSQSFDLNDFIEANYNKSYAD